MSGSDLPDRGTVELLRVLLPLQALRAGAAPPRLGTYAHGMIFRLLERVDPALGRALHQSQQRPEFTASPLLNTEGHLVAVTASGQWYWVQLAFTSPRAVAGWVAVEQWLHDFARQSLESSVESIGERVRPVFHLGPGDSSHGPDEPCPWDYQIREDPPLRQTARFDDLLGEQHDAWALHFVTPTTFELGGSRAERQGAPDIFQPWPSPERVLSNLAGAWQQLAPAGLAGLADRARVRSLADQVQVEAGHLDIAPVALPVTDRRMGRQADPPPGAASRETTRGETGGRQISAADGSAGGGGVC